ncbi:flagellar hook-length control protein FliK [Xylophilus ampelinus]|uniref:Flagellar hook-length control protein FliK n=1 Tax=Xylophilus ampelinus TaxID=54067 RepID=A0A318SUF4_9BURK|nr:flagellar hook-length control protein FliK [Xylophilus ampelinus]MCS4511751.1 flagellar hook-length control protein FliK [Xylophilus ampelinus]PYE73745.1 flagellar hook-length control protein FliK [Xylophilus ampelinus]
MAIESKPIAAAHARPVRNEASRAAGVDASPPADAFSSLLGGFGAEEAVAEGDAAAGDGTGIAGASGTSRGRGKGALGIAAADGLQPDAAAVALSAAQWADARPAPPPAGTGGDAAADTAGGPAGATGIAFPAAVGSTGAGSLVAAAGTTAPGVAAEAGRAAMVKADVSAAAAAATAAHAALAATAVGTGAAGTPLQNLDASWADGTAARLTATVAGAAAGTGTATDGAAAAAGKTAAGLAGFTSILAQMQHAFARNGAARDAGTAGGADSVGAVATGTAPGAAGLSGLAARSGTGSVAADARDALRTGADPARSLSAADLLSLAPAGADTPRGGHGGGDRPSAGASDAAPTAGFGISGTGDAAAWRSVSAADASATAVQDGTAQLSAEDRLADQVSYWVNQKTQSAELTLDAFGGVPVEVRISLTGSDAQVSFRSDQADARALLGGAEADLREMLQKEGLNLTGLSIGGSEARGATQSGNGGNGSGNGNGRDGGRDGPGARPGGVAGVDGVASGGTARAPAGAVAGRGLDLFV